MCNKCKIDLADKENKIYELESKKNNLYRNCLMMAVVGLTMLYISLPMLYEFSFTHTIDLMVTIAIVTLFFIIFYYIDSRYDKIESNIEEIEIEIEFLQYTH
jgi:Ca2+/Na+ antiporter